MRHLAGGYRAIEMQCLSVCLSCLSEEEKRRSRNEHEKKSSCPVRTHGTAVLIPCDRCTVQGTTIQNGTLGDSQYGRAIRTGNTDGGPAPTLPRTPTRTVPYRTVVCCQAPAAVAAYQAGPSSFRQFSPQGAQEMGMPLGRETSKHRVTNFKRYLASSGPGSRDPVCFLQL